MRYTQSELWKLWLEPPNIREIIITFLSCFHYIMLTIFFSLVWAAVFPHFFLILALFHVFFFVSDTIFRSLSLLYRFFCCSPPHQINVMYPKLWTDMEKCQRKSGKYQFLCRHSFTTIVVVVNILVSTALWL